MSIEQSADAATPPARIAHYMKMRAVTIQYLRMLENELIGMGGIRPQDRACLIREERRQSEANNQKGLPNYDDDR